MDSVADKLFGTFNRISFFASFLILMAIAGGLFLKQKSTDKKFSDLIDSTCIVPEENYPCPIKSTTFDDTTYCSVKCDVMGTPRDPTYGGARTVTINYDTSGKKYVNLECVNHASEFKPKTEYQCWLEKDDDKGFWSKDPPQHIRKLAIGTLVLGLMFFVGWLIFVVMDDKVDVLWAFIVGSVLWVVFLCIAILYGIPTVH